MGDAQSRRQLYAMQERARIPDDISAGIDITEHQQHLERTSRTLFCQKQGLT